MASRREGEPPGTFLKQGQHFRRSPFLLCEYRSRAAGPAKRVVNVARQREAAPAQVGRQGVADSSPARRELVGNGAEHAYAGIARAAAAEAYYEFAASPLHCRR